MKPHPHSAPNASFCFRFAGPERCDHRKQGVKLIIWCSTFFKTQRKVVNTWLVSRLQSLQAEKNHFRSNSVQNAFRVPRSSNPAVKQMCCGEWKIKLKQFCCRESTSQKHMDVTTAQAVPQAAADLRKGTTGLNSDMWSVPRTYRRLNLAKFLWTSRTWSTCECAGTIITHPKAAQGKGASSSSPWT